MPIYEARNGLEPLPEHMCEMLKNAYPLFRDSGMIEAICTAQDRLTELEKAVGVSVQYNGVDIAGPASAINFHGDGLVVVDESGNVVGVTQDDRNIVQGTAGEPIGIGVPVYLNPIGGKYYAAVAAGMPQARVVGFATITAAGDGSAIEILTHGEVAVLDWTAIAGTAALAEGVSYFLDPATNGRITTVRPTAAGQYSSVVGTALSPTSLKVNILHPVKLL